MYVVTLQTSARKTETIGHFKSYEVAKHVASGLSGYESEDGPLAGTVEELIVNDAESVEDYKLALQVDAELAERQRWAEFYEGLSPVHKHLIDKYGAPVEVVVEA